MKNPFVSMLPLFSFIILLSACQNGSVQLHDHVRQDLQSLGAAVDQAHSAEVKLHDHVEADLQRLRDEGTFHVRLHDHVREDLHTLRHGDLNIRFHDHVLNHMSQVGLNPNRAE